jgi:Tetratricopeptide repeat
MKPSRTKIWFLCLPLLAAASLLWQAPAQAKKKKAPPPIIGTPQVVQDLRWGDVLFYFYQGDYIQALTRLDAAEQMHLLTHHEVEAQLLKGGLYLSLGEHREAGRIFESLLAGNVAPDVRDRAWFYLGKIWYQRGYYEESEKALHSIQGVLPADIEPERYMIEAQVLLQQGRYDDAIAVLERWQPAKKGNNTWTAYAKFNIGVALVRKDRLDDAARVLDAVGQIDASTEELAALRDKANLALGFAYLKANRAVDAKTVLERVRLEGPYSNKALLGLGWANATEQSFQKALVPWTELRDRNLLDAAVQESYLAIPYAYAQLGAEQQSAGEYLHAVDAYQEEGKRIDESIASIQSGHLLEAVLKNDTAKEVGWYWQLKNLPDAPETRYLFHLLAQNDFQEGLKNYRDLRLMQDNIASWQLSVDAFDDMVDTRRRAYALRLPELQNSLDKVDMDALEARKNDLESRLTNIEHENDIAGLATDHELEQWDKIKRIEAALATADQSDPLTQEMAEKARLIKGVLLWNFNASYKARDWREHKELRELDVAFKESVRRNVLVSRAREDYPQRTEEFAQRVTGLHPRLDDLSARLATAADAQNRYLAQIAVRELESQKQRLYAYSLQARFALASMYDRASNGGKGEPSHPPQSEGAPPPVQPPPEGGTP